MKKEMLSILILMVISIVACQQAVKKEVTEKMPEAPKLDATGEATVDSVGKDLDNVNNVEKDLSTEELSDLDAGLADMQNI